MATGSQPASTPFRFGVFELDLKSGELRKNGSKLRLEGQPLQILAMLLERPGEVVTREELKQKLWAEDTFVDFEHGINTGIRRLREALNDSADAPRYIETLPRRGYRFIYPLAAPLTAAPAQARTQRAVLVVTSLALAAVLLGIFVFRERLFPPKAEITSIAVLPLQNLTGDPGQDYLAAGFTETLITELGKHDAIRVLSHQTMSQYSGSKKPISVIARDQGVDSVIEGKVMRHGDRLRVTINFIQLRPERHLMSEKYDRRMDELFPMQDQIALDIVGKVRARMSPEQRRHFAKSRVLDPDVNEAYMKGLFYSGPSRQRETYQSTPESDLKKAAAYFEEVIKKAPDFAPAYARMALLDAHAGRSERRAKARQMAIKALELDDTQAEAHVALAWLEFTDWDFAGAEREFQRAIALNPNLAVARIWYVSYLTCLWRFDEADDQGAIALRLNPVSADTLTHVAHNYLYSGRVEKAIELYRKALELEPDYAGGHWALGRAYYVQGKCEESVAALEKAIAERGRTFPNLNVIGAAYLKAGKRQEGLAVLRELEKQWTERGGAGSGMGALVYVALGDYDKAFARLERAFERRGTYLIAILADPMFEPLRSDPRYHDLVRRMGFPPDSLRRAGVPTESVPPVQARGTPARSGR